VPLDHEKLDVYRVSLDFAAWAYVLCKMLHGMDRHVRDQLLRASQSIALNIAEGCGKLPSADRERFFQIAAGSARECGAILDILVRCEVIEPRQGIAGKDLLVRIVAMLTKMVGRFGEVRDGAAACAYVNGYEYAADQELERAAADDSAARRSAGLIQRMSGRGDGRLTTEQIMALTRGEP